MSLVASLSEIDDEELFSQLLLPQVYLLAGDLLKENNKLVVCIITLSLFFAYEVRRDCRVQADLCA